MLTDRKLGNIIMSSSFIEIQKRQNAKGIGFIYKRAEILQDEVEER